MNTVTHTGKDTAGCWLLKTADHLLHRSDPADMRTRMLQYTMNCRGLCPLQVPLPIPTITGAWLYRIGGVGGERSHIVRRKGVRQQTMSVSMCLQVLVFDVRRAGWAFVDHFTIQDQVAVLYLDLHGFRFRLLAGFFFVWLS